MHSAAEHLTRKSELEAQLEPAINALASAEASHEELSYDAQAGDATAADLKVSAKALDKAREALRLVQSGIEVAGRRAEAAANAAKVSAQSDAMSRIREHLAQRAPIVEKLDETLDTLAELIGAYLDNAQAIATEVPKTGSTYRLGSISTSHEVVFNAVHGRIRPLDTRRQMERPNGNLMRGDSLAATDRRLTSEIR